MIEPIEHLDDPRVAAYRHVADHAWVEAHGLFVAEGRLIVRRLLEDRRLPIHSFLLTPPAHAALGDLLRDVASPVFLCSQQVMDGLTGFNFHRGCLAMVERGNAVVSPDSLHASRIVVGLEGVANPDNVGGIFRNALALGADGVILNPTSGDPLYRKAIRTSMGAVLRVPFARMEDWPQGLVQFREAGFTIVALTPATDATDINVFAASRGPGRLVLLAGHEGHGLTGAAMAASDVRCRIPVDPRSDSLNVAVAVGIALAITSSAARTELGRHAIEGPTNHDSRGRR